MDTSKSSEDSIVRIAEKIAPFARIKLSISKEIQEKFKSRSINFLIPKRLKKLINFESIKMIKIVKKEEEIEMEIIYERKEKEERKIA